MAGKPVVACRTGGLKDLILHRETGSLVEPGQPAEMARAIVEILTNSPLAQRMGQAGQRRALEEFTLEKMSASFATFYRLLLEGAAGLPRLTS